MITADHFYIVVGLGNSGMSIVRFLVNRGMLFAVADTRNNPPGLAALRRTHPHLEVCCGELDVEFLCRADELYVSPGVDLATYALQAAAARGVKLSGDIDLFARYAKAPIVAISGSNAKSTVTTLVGEMAAMAGKRVAVGGNIGMLALDLLSDDIELYVIELSSFQLDTTHNLSAEVATVLNISEDHMNRYSSFTAYCLAKHRIFQSVKQLVVNRHDALSCPLIGENQTCWTFGLSKPDFKSFGIREKNGEQYLAFEFQNLMLVRDLKIRGAHNQSNALAALALGHAVGLPFDAMLASLRMFTGLEHRCQWVRNLNGVSYYNDSKATNVGATLAAIEGLSSDIDGKIVLIAGGDSKGANLKDLIKPVATHCRAVVLIGSDSNLIYATLGNAALQVRVMSLNDAIIHSRALAEPGDVVLLSPACASFDMFKNYEERGQLFTRAVEALV
ncbi:UDP-N-acetylmuramoyl-L-alanine--D-glutamate ligase [Candidatus Pseudomonas adelgestsugas]|uniref:UDP-N-acetylmuramoylalanine--D-glutamate ligase n=1 Tax=Candidatus Pseudomonas adelgestsugas TaxID=1302376 RepID=A0ABX5R8D2_9PSED|nr:UDP-N-acetylmuramoyl-L-alanine--D-glutamate ligase [Candidatus Pseudomonas adelgestsugas]QAX81911.1 UDP-N-acetylmuramoylalanine--D-glutamate ligase [Candidatus Pseudomonas adelgestsugas]